MTILVNDIYSYSKKYHYKYMEAYYFSNAPTKHILFKILNINKYNSYNSK